MTEEELEQAMIVHDRRHNVFMAEGLCESEATSLADQMLNRDNDIGDDRRVCFECTGYVARRCTKIFDKFGKPTMPLRFVLQRCDYFELKGKKSKVMNTYPDAPLTEDELHLINESKQHQERE
jgi:hypothetical protein